MSIGFDNPGLLPFSLLMGLPVLIHLIARPRPRLLKYPSLMLLEKAHRESVRFQRPKHWLLLILRTLWTLLILGVFLQPRWYTFPREGQAGGSRAVILVVDATASMRATEGTQTRYTQAVTESISILQQLQAGDRANVIRVRAVSEAFYTGPGTNHDYLKTELRTRSCSREGGELNAAIQLAVEQLAKRPEKNREIIVISDFQPGKDGQAPRLDVPEGIRLTTLPVAKGTVPNQAVSGIRLVPARPVSDLPFQVQVEVTNFSDQAVQRQVVLQVGEQHEQQNLRLPPGESTLALFEFKMEAVQSLALTASLEADTFPADDVRHSVVPLRPALRIGVWGSDRTADLWLRSLQALEGIQGLQVKSLDVLPADLDALYLSGWQGDFLAEIQSFIGQGGSVVMKPAKVTGEMSAWLKIPSGPLAPGELDAPLALRIPDPWPATLELFQEGQYGSPAKAVVKRHAQFPIQHPPLDPILALENGETVWGEFSNHPGVYYWNLSLDPDHSDLIAQSEWIPMFGEGINHLFRPSEETEEEAGTQLALVGNPDAGWKPTLLNTTHEPVAIKEVDGVYTSAEPLSTGLYRWKDGPDGNHIALRAVNLPVAESDLSVTEPVSTTGKALPKLDQAATWQQSHEGRPLWPALLVLAFGVAATEHFFTQRRARI